MQEWSSFLYSHYQVDIYINNDYYKIQKKTYVSSIMMKILRMIRLIKDGYFLAEGYIMEFPSPSSTPS